MAGSVTMNNARWLLAGLLWLTVWPGASHAQSPDLTGAYQRFSELYAQGHYQQALPFAEKAFRLGEREFGPDHPTTGTLLNNLAELYRVQGHYAEAEPLFRRSLAIREKALGPEETIERSSDQPALITKCGR